MDRVKVKEAAEILGVSQQYVRIGMQRGWLPIGSCVKMSSHWTYHISRERLNAYLQGKDIVDFYFDKKTPPSGNWTATALQGKAERT